MGKYAKLTHCLKGMKNPPLVLTFDEIEKILGFKLPPSYRNYPCMWYGSSGKSPTHGLKKAIAAAGYHVKNVDLVNETVTLC